MMKRELLDNGNIWQKSDGRWIGMVRYKDEFGATQRKSFTSKKKKTLQAKMTEYVKNFNEQVTNSDEARKPLKESMKNWLRVYKFPEVERTTYDRYECTAEHQIYPYIGNKPVGDVTPADIKKLLTKHMNKGYNLADLLQHIQARQSLPNADYYLFLLRKIKDELQQQKGKKLYGYLPRKLKRLVDFALHEIAKDRDLAEIYSKWNEVNREKLSLYYDTKDNPDVPIEKTPELRSLKNLLIRTALRMNFNVPVAVNTARIGFLFSMLAKQIVNSAGKRLDELNKMMPLTESKERAKIREKKLAHGQKEGADSSGIDDEVYDSQAVEGILTMLDYFISLGNQESKPDNEVDTLPEESYDFDNAYAEYLNDEDDGNDDIDDEDEEYFGLSM